MTAETILTDEQIEESLINAGVVNYWNPMSRYDVDVARAILQSPQVQRLKNIEIQAEKVTVMCEGGEYLVLAEDIEKLIGILRRDL